MKKVVLTLKVLSLSAIALLNSCTLVESEEKYKQVSLLDFSHSNIISVFDKQGVLSHQQEGLSVNSKETISKIIEQNTDFE